MTKNTDHQGNIEECKSIFVSWTWLVITIVGGLTLVGGMVYGYTRTETLQESALSRHGERLNNLEKYSQDLDTIKMLLRRK